MPGSITAAAYVSISGLNSRDPARIVDSALRIRVVFRKR